MSTPDSWTNYAEAMEMSIEGNRLIARAIVQVVRSLGKRLIHTADALLHSVGQQRHLPPV